MIVPNRPLGPSVSGLSARPGPTGDAAPFGTGVPASAAPASNASTSAPVVPSLLTELETMLRDLAQALSRLLARWTGPVSPPNPVQSPVPSPAPAPVPAPTSSQPATPGAVAGPVGVTGNWMPIFDDEFNQPEQWGKVWSQMRANHWQMNNVTTNPENASVTNGVASLTLANSSSGAYMSTDAKDGGGGFMMDYGYAEARIKLPMVNGQIVGWPAWWICGDQWPAQGEADIFEGLGGNATSNYHSNNGADNSGTIAGDWSGWHTFGIDREPGVNRIYFDGKLVRTYQTYDNGAPEALILNYGSGGGPQVDGATMQVDYVRVWQHAGS